MPGPLLLFFVFLAVVIALGIAGHRAAQKRRQELQAYASSRGFQFLPDRGPPPEGLRRMPPLRSGSNRYAYNTLRGEWELSEGVWTPFQAGDYHYQVTSGSGKNRKTTHYHLSYLALNLPVGPAPQVAVRRENFFDSISAAIGFDDIDFESAEFSRKFHVSSEDKRFAYDLIHPRAMEMMLAKCPGRLDLAGSWLLLTDGTKRWKPAEFDEWLAWSRGFLVLWPRHLTTDSPGSQPRTLAD